MLRGKRAVITGGGTGFGQALSVWLAREGVEVDFCARRADDIQKTCSIITAEGGMAKGHLCDLTLPESLSQFSSQLLTLDKPIDILILNAAQWLSGTLDDQSDTEIIMKWFTEFGHLNRGDMLTSEQHRCHNEKKKFQRRV